MRWLLLFAFVPAAFGQLDSDTFSITSTRTSNVEINQFQVTVYVDAAADMSLDDVLSVLKETGITTANLSGASTNFFNLSYVGQTPAQHTRWTFVLTDSLSKLNGTLAALGRVNRSGVSLDYYLNA